MTLCQFYIFEKTFKKITKGFECLIEFSFPGSVVPLLPLLLRRQKLSSKNYISEVIYTYICLKKLDKMEQVSSLRFPMGTTHLMIGVSGSGKTHRMANILRYKDELFENGSDIKNILFCYADWQDAYTDLRNENIVTTWTNIDYLIKLPNAKVVPFTKLNQIVADKKYL